MTTAAERSRDDGQSLLEFIFMLPLMVGMAVILLRICTVIQISIVNQKYSRAQALWLTFNSAYYPRTKLVTTDLFPKGYNKMVVGVSDELVTDSEEGTKPKATTYKIARSKKTEQVGSNADNEEPKERIEVRVRNTVTLCTPLVYYRAGASKRIPTLATHPEYVAPPEGVAMDFCRGPLDE